MITFEERRKLELESSLIHWFEKISKTKIPLPKTVILELSDKEIEELMGLLDGKMISKHLRQGILTTAREIGYPMFIRTDQASSKHNFLSAAYVESEKQLLGHIASTIEHHVEAGFPFGLQWRALVFREYIPLNAKFKAFNHMPVARERRYFVKGGKVECQHSYWVEDAIYAYGHTGCVLPEDWKSELRKINLQDDAEQRILTIYAEQFSKLIPGYWSVDFAQAATGQWYLIDAARGEVSWHPEDCPYCPEDSKTPKQEHPDLSEMLIQKKEADEHVNERERV